MRSRKYVVPEIHLIPSPPEKTKQKILDVIKDTSLSSLQLKKKREKDFDATKEGNKGFSYVFVAEFLITAEFKRRAII